MFATLITTLFLWHMMHPVAAPMVRGAMTAHAAARTFPVVAARDGRAPQEHAFPHHATLAPVRLADVPPLALPHAHAVAVIDVQSGAVLYEKAATQPRAIASITKILTAALVRTSGIALEHRVTIRPAEAQFGIGSRIGCTETRRCEGVRLAAGEQVTVRDLLTAMLVASANDAALVLARVVAGDVPRFVARMNARARALGIAQPAFCSPNGLEVEDRPCVSSALAIARIAAATSYDRFLWHLLAQPQATIRGRMPDGTVRTHTLTATNQFATGDVAPLEGMVGAKTGYTARAGKSLLVLAAHPQDPAIRVVAVLLDDPQRWEDMRALLAWVWRAWAWNIP